ncbi:MAG: pentapeptide repeat-containing protein [Candidatus Korobacteraceae bacterium]
MANPEHLAKLKEGVKAWNQWREQNPEIRPDLVAADLHSAQLGGANLREADLFRVFLSLAQLVEADLGKADLRKADLSKANLHSANLRRACLFRVNLGQANLREVDLSKANLVRADLYGADLSGANLSEADLRGATLVSTNLEGANLTGCNVYGVSAWNVRLEGAIQSNLVITPKNESPIQVDNLEVAQFIYLLLNNQKIRSVIDTITSKVVLILGRFTPERKVVLDAIRDELRKRDYLPVLFDFEKPASKDLTGTISTLANMARFIVADLTNPSSVPHELATLVPGTVVPVQTIIMKGRRKYAMFTDLKRRYHWVLEPHQYKSQELLIAQLGETVIAPAEAKAKELARK